MLVDKPLFCPAGEPQRPYLQASGINHGPCHSRYGNTVEDRIAGSIATFFVFICIRTWGRSRGSHGLNSDVTSGEPGSYACLELKKAILTVPWASWIYWILSH